MDVSVVVATYNREELLGDTLAALTTQRTSSSLCWEIIVVDNNSRDSTPEVVQKFARIAPVPLRYVFEPRQGVSHARNAGVKESQGQIVAFTDDDVIPEGNWVASVASAMKRWNADVIGGRILPRWCTPPPRWLASDRRRLQPFFALVDYAEPRVLNLPMKGDPQIWGANMAFRRDYFEDIGLFDALRGVIGRKLYRGEEVELIDRALGRDRMIVYDPSLTVWHQIGADRMRKAYVRKLFFDSGEGAALVAAAPTGPTILGVPRWMYRAVATAWVTWATYALFRRSDSFACQLDAFWMMGRLWGYLKTRNGTDQLIDH